MNIMLSYLILILAAHWVGDFALQSNTMAKEKSRSIRWLLTHVLVYILPISACSFYIFTFSDALWFIALNASLHFVTDLFTSRLANKFQSDVRYYFLIIGFDQLIHNVTLLITVFMFIEGL